MATGKTITLTMRNFVSKVMSLLFNMLSRFVIEGTLSNPTALFVDEETELRAAL